MSQNTIMLNIPTLIIDDEEVDRYLLTRFLKKTKLNVNICEKTNGKEALEFLKEYDKHASECPEIFPPILIFLDINMPLLNGHQFLAEFQELRKSLDYSASVVMMFTSSDSEEDKAKIMQYDFVKDYLVKGEVNADILKEKIVNILDFES